MEKGCKGNQRGWIHGTLTHGRGRRGWGGSQVSGLAHGWCHYPRTRTVSSENLDRAGEVSDPRWGMSHGTVLIQESAPLSNPLGQGAGGGEGYAISMKLPRNNQSEKLVFSPTCGYLCIISSYIIWRKLSSMTVLQERTHCSWNRQAFSKLRNWPVTTGGHLPCSLHSLSPITLAAFLYSPEAFISPSSGLYLPSFPSTPSSNVTRAESLSLATLFKKL